MTLRLYVDAALAEGVEFDLPPGAARHVQVRRAQPGDPLVLFDGRGGEWQAEVTAMGRSRVGVRIGAHDPVEREPTITVHIALGVPANERMDTLVEKATELGVASIQPLLTERSVLRLAGDRAERKRQHWQAIAVAAAEQCGRTRVPGVAPLSTLAAWLATPGPDDAARWLLSPGDGTAALRQQPGPAACTVLSGPEGGLSTAEEAAAVAAGFVRIGLGARVLRADTAPLAVLAWTMLQG